MKLLLLEDDHALGQAAKSALMRQGMAVDWTQSAAEFSNATVKHCYDCMLMDLKLPDGDGGVLLEHMRRRGDNTPVIVITAQWQGESSVSLLDRGADDYLVKPYDTQDLMARIRAVLRRAGAAD